MSSPAHSAARRAGIAVLAAILFAVVAPVVIWFDDRLIALALLGDGVVLGPVSPALRAVGIATTLLPSLCLGWGLFALMPALRPIGRGEVAPRVGIALHRLGLSVLIVGLYEPLGRAVLLAALTLAPGRLAIEIGMSTNAVLLVALGATLMALGPVLRGAAAALEENQGFV
ncbi:hypothetical protein KPL78_19865 [Roseomonas sp. HJA6]|uniref:DUF2975 domain-containing protein n=1 Tax=Roseomonas alba TaxID=2846776 RepID=A0ABS7ACU5_9PROT|nr:hypothetical protein [Neoroseomonas alba]MBW6400126.1 hypothetical protein [Neoroseomonas alba]